MLEIRVLGELEVMRAGAVLPLPQSRKTRALLGYLAATGRPHRRERLCELLWDVPDDPRGALRWSLSKLRGLLDDAEPPLIVADRQSVALGEVGLGIDLGEVRAALARGVDAASTADLEAAAARFRGDLLADLDLPSCPPFQAWLASLREEMHALHRQVLQTLADRLAADPAAALPHLRELVRTDPYDEAGWARLVRQLIALGRTRDAEDQYAAARAVLAQAAGVTPVLDQAMRAPAPAPAPAPSTRERAEDLHQEIRFCRAQGGARIAYAVVGRGPPLVKAANWMNHLEYDWESPIWGHFLHGLARKHQLWRYDARGNGLSDWDAGELGLDAWVSDLEAVVDCSGLDRFPLLGVSQGCAISIAYAVRHPERVTRLILYAGFAAGTYRREGEGAEHEKRRALTTLMRLGWGQPNPAFRQIFTSMFIPGASQEQMDSFNELQRRTTSPECAARYYEASGHLDVRHLLEKVSVPTLVLHPRGDANIPVELGRRMAAGIPGAQFVPLPGQNHLVLEGEPAAERFFEEFDRFLEA